MIAATLATVLAVLGGLAATDGDLSCPDPDQPNCGEANGAGDWLPEPAGPAEPVTGSPSFTG